MNKRLISVLMFAFLVAGGASLILYKLVIGHVSSAATVSATFSVVVAVKNLDPGQVIVAADVRLAEWPGAVPQGAVVKVADLVGRGVTSPIYANEPITESRLDVKGGGGGLASTIPLGMRAVAIRVNEVAGVAGFVVAGTHVDVLVSGSPPDAAGGTTGNITKTLLQNVSVLSAGQDFKKDTEGKPVTVQVVNLLVNPEQAEMLSLASGSMTMQLVLRNPRDTAITSTPQVSLASIMSGQPVARLSPASHFSFAKAEPLLAAPAPPPAELPRIEIIEGSKRTDIKVQKPEASDGQIR